MHNVNINRHTYIKYTTCKAVAIEEAKVGTEVSGCIVSHLPTTFQSLLINFLFILVGEPGRGR